MLEKKSYVNLHEIEDVLRRLAITVNKGDYIASKYVCMHMPRMCYSSSIDIIYSDKWDMKHYIEMCVKVHMYIQFECL